MDQMNLANAIGDFISDSRGKKFSILLPLPALAVSHHHHHHNEYTMGAVLCCMRQPSAKDDQLISNKSQYASPAISFNEQCPTSSKTREKSHLNTSENKYSMIGSMTLQDCLLASPNINPHSRMGGEIQIFKPLPRMSRPTSPEGSHDIFKQRMSFSADRSRVIDETYEYERNSSANSMSRTASGKLGKKVTFRLPEEADVYLYYTPKETFEDDSKLI